MIKNLAHKTQRTQRKTRTALCGSGTLSMPTVSMWLFLLKLTEGYSPTGSLLLPTAYCPLPTALPAYCLLPAHWLFALPAYCPLDWLSLPCLLLTAYCLFRVVRVFRGPLLPNSSSKAHQNTEPSSPTRLPASHSAPSSAPSLPAKYPVYAVPDHLPATACAPVSTYYS